MARKSIWEQVYESTEGPTVTVTIPRDHAESLLHILAASLEDEGLDGLDDDGDEDDMGDLDFGDDEGGGDEDDMDSMGDLDLDFMPAGDDDEEEVDEPSPHKKGPGRPPGSKNKPKADDSKKEKKPEEDDDSDDDDTKEESVGPEDGNRPQTALGESAFARAARALKPRGKR